MAEVHPEQQQHFPSLIPEENDMVFLRTPSEEEHVDRVHMHQLEWEQYSSEQKARLLDRFYKVMEKRQELPSWIRDAIDKTIGPITSIFLSAIEGCARELLLDVGLDCHRETEDEVETMVRLFPKVLEDHGYGDCPILHAARGILSDEDEEGSLPESRQLLKSISFIPILAELGVELGGNYYLPKERGGLLVKDESGRNVLQYLASNHKNSFADEGGKDDESVDKLLEKQKLRVMKRLRDQELFHKRDIRKHHLLYELCKSEGYFPPFGAMGSRFKRRNGIASTRFDFLVDWDPKSLSKRKYPGGDQNRPLHHCTRFLGSNNNGDDDRFRRVLKAGMKHFPEKLGFAFHENRSGQTPYRLACKKIGRKETHKLLRESLKEHKQPKEKGNFSFHSRTCPDEPLLIEVASNPDIHLDGIFFLVRRDPSAIALGGWETIT